MQIRMRALRAAYVPASRREFAAGQEFTVTERDAKRLERSRRAARVQEIEASPQSEPAPPPPEAPAPEAPEDQSNTPPFPEPETDPEIKPSRRYRRRDMQAEDEGLQD